MSRNKIILYFLGVASLLFLGVLIYGVLKIRGENQIISQISNQADSDANESALAGSIKSVKNNNLTNINKIDNIIINDNDLVPFLESLEKIGTDVGLTIKTTSLVQDNGTSKSVKYPLIVHIAVETDGPWVSSLKFIEALENLPTKVAIDSVSLSLGALIQNSGLPTQVKVVKPIGNVWHTSSNLTINIFK